MARAGTAMMLLAGGLAGGLHAATDNPGTAFSTPYLRMPRRAPSVEGWRVVPAYDGIRIPNLVGFAPEPGTTRLVAFTRDGRVVAFDDRADVTETVPLLDLSGQTMSLRGDAGLVNLVFHPGYADPASAGHGSLFVWYNYSTFQGDPGTEEIVTHVRLSRFRTEPGATRIDPGTEEVLIEQEDRHLYHTGGGMFFHPQDGFLYVALSDEGGGNDQYRSAQQITENFFSGVIRIDVDRRGGGISRPIVNQPQRGRTDGYFIPLDNPWIDEPGALHEFFAVGLRNPHRMSFDPVDGIGFIADVGQSQREEINRLVPGANYQWPYREGLELGPRVRPDPPIGIETPPLWSYGRDLGFCVIGGHVYRGRKWGADLYGHYVFGDLGGNLFALDPHAPQPVDARRIGQLDGAWSVVGFGQDHADELYFCHMIRGRIYTLEAETDGTLQLPERLSQTGAFEDVATLRPAPDLFPYEVNSALWSDGASKARWMALPAAATFREDAPWTYPPGTVFVKHFGIRTHWADPGSIRRLETRLLVLDETGGAYGVTYRWNEDGTDAELLPGGLSEDIRVETPEGPDVIRWRYPGRADCMTCHTEAAGYVLGGRTAQLNRDGVAHARNQIVDLATRGWLSGADPDRIEEVPRLVDPRDTDAPLESRARAYLDANCSGCHRPGGARVALDLRAGLSLAGTGLFFGAADNLGIPGLRLLDPGHPENSAIWQRTTRRGDSQMPPLGTAHVDPVGTALLEEWIRSLNASRPAVTAVWNGSGDVGYSIPMPNLVPTLETVEEDTDWLPYHGKPPVLARGVTGPGGLPNAIRFGSADLGGPWGIVSGVVARAPVPLQRGTYVVRVWLRTVEGAMRMRMGLTDWGGDEVFEVTDQWRLFEHRVQWNPCGCYADDRIFQVYEAEETNPAWEMTQPRVFRAATTTVELAVESPVEPVIRVSLVREPDGKRLASGDGSAPLAAVIESPGLHRVRVEAETGSGIVGRSEPLDLWSGTPPSLRWEARPEDGRPGLLLEMPAGHPFRIDQSTDLVEWEEGEPRSNGAAIRWLDEPGADPDTPGRFFRLEPLPR